MANEKVTVKIGADITDIQNKLKILKKDANDLNIGKGLVNSLETATKNYQKVNELINENPSMNGFKAIDKSLNGTKGILGSVQDKLTEIRGILNNGEGFTLLSKSEQTRLTKVQETINSFFTNNRTKEFIPQKELDKASQLEEKLAKANKELSKTPDDKKKLQSAVELNKTYEKYIQQLERIKELEEKENRTANENRELGQLKGKNGIQKTRIQLQEDYAATGIRGNFFRQGTDTINPTAQTFLAKNKDAQNELLLLKDREKELKQEVTDVNTELAEQNRLLDELAKKSYLGKMQGYGFTDEENLLQQDTATSIVTEEQVRQVNEFSDGAERAEKATGELIQTTQQSIEVNKQNADSYEAENKAASQVQGIKDRVASIFSLASATVLLRRGIQNAVSTIKELDATMTETAVVTDFTVSDMWDQLPEYTKRASALGVAINDAYESATLFYQQGLKTEQVIALSNATLKMARIAGLNASEATDRMTNALRGFNMTLNETNATNVADVYSKLAAITASDVNEISTAMTKVASLANSANMTFENTAAFLAQIIETTRESAETAGTALKTVVARFAEIKTNPSEIANIDGEAASYNNIDKALRSVGISLDAFMKGEEGLDQVLMRLAEKWDSLSTTTQRYIATQAAGSRQQSRFIALMSDYARTQELVAASNNAAGASAEQYEKTLDSLQTKINQLKNAWDTFTMGVANSDFVKGVIDIGTSIINGLNKINEKADGLWGSLTRLGTAFLVFKTGQKVVNGFLNSLTGLGQQASKTKDILSILTFGEQRFKKELSKGNSLLTSMNKISKASTNGTLNLNSAINILTGGMSNKFNNVFKNSKKALEVFKTGISGLLPVLGKLALAIGAVVAVALVFKAIYKNSLAGQLQDAKKKLEILKTSCQDAADSFKNLADSIAQLKDEENIIAELAVGTSEWTAQVISHNEAVKDLLDTYGLLSDIKYTDSGIAYIDNATEDIINTKAKSNYVQASAAQNSAQNRVNQLQYQSDYKKLKNKYGYNNFDEVLSNLVANNGIITPDIEKQFLYELDDDTRKAFENLAQEQIRNKEALFNNTKSIVSLNNTLEEGEPGLVGQNSAYQDSYETLKTQDLNAGLEEFLKQKFIDYYNEQLPIFQAVSAGETNPQYADNIVKQFNELQDQFIAEYMDANSKLTQADINKYNIKIANTVGQTNLNDTLKNSLFTAIQAIEEGRANTLGSLNLDQATFKQLNVDTLKSDNTQLNASLDQLNNSGNQSSAVFNAALEIDNISDSVWTKLYQGFYNGGKDYNFDLESFSVRELYTLQEAMQNFQGEEYTGLQNAITQAISSVIEANKAKTYDNYKSSAYAQVGSLATGDLDGQAAFYENAAKAITGFKGDLVDAEGEIKNSAVATINLASQLERAALYGEDLAKACIDYSNALDSNDIKEQNQALSDMVGYLSGITGLTVTSDMILEDGATDYIKNATNSIQDYAKMLDYFTAQTIQNSTALTREQKQALTELKGGYNSAYGTIASNQNIIDSFNESILNGTLTLEQLGTILGQQYKLNIVTNAEGKEILSSIEAIGNNSSLTSTFNKITESITYWENPLEKHYQLLKDINKEQRNLNKLQHAYELSTMVASGYQGDIVKSLQEQLDSQKQQLDQQYTLLNSYQADLDAIVKKYGKTYSKYFTKDTNGNIVGLNESSWRASDGKLNADKSTAKALDKIYEAWTDAQTGLEEAEDAIMSIESEIAKQRSETYKDYWDLVSETIDMLVEKQQQDLDNQEEIINNQKSATDALINSISNNFKQLRQDRQNEKTESDITKLTKQISYLKQDTTGANATQIRQLEEQLKDQTTSYTDSLIDQAISKMEESYNNDYEYQQNMLDYQSAQLKHMEEINAFEEEAVELIAGMVDESGNVNIENSKWYELYQDMNPNATTGSLYIKQNEIASSIGYIQTYFPSLIADAVNASKQNPNTLDTQTSTKNITNSGKTDNQSGLSNDTNGDKKPKGYKLIVNGVGQSGIYSTESDANSVKASKVQELQNELTLLEKKINQAKSGVVETKLANQWSEKKLEQDFWRNAKIQAVYKTGGLADFTGPAWLDGTKSNPELVLNAKDTENFIQLKDILRSFMSSSTTNNTVGDSYFDIDVNVDNIASEYDISQIAEDIKYSIFKDASYRNINNISTLK